MNKLGVTEYYVLSEKDRAKVDEWLDGHAVAWREMNILEIQWDGSIVHFECLLLDEKKRVIRKESPHDKGPFDFKGIGYDFEQTQPFPLEVST